jgi:D-arginine dehydrogenase
MENASFDVLVIGAGIAGATCAAALSTTHRVALIEAEEQAGYHTTGRSAATWVLNYGPPDVRVLTGLSRPFLTDPPPGFTETTLTGHRAMLFICTEGLETSYDAELAAGVGLRELTVAEALDYVPALRPGYVKAAAIEEDAFDLDVAAIHQGFLRQLRRNGGVLALRSRAGRIERRGGHWHAETTSGTVFAAPVLINAAGAWGDEIARAAQVAPIGLRPLRRTGLIVDAAPWMPADWPMVHDFSNPWYCRAEARTKLLVSPADATLTEPQDAQPDELDIAIAIDRMQQAMEIEVRRVERAWAGLRTFTPDGSLAIGWDAAAAGFFWCVGQGGYGIQTSPAAGALVAALVRGANPGAAAPILPAIDPRRFALAGD